MKFGKLLDSDISCVFIAVQTPRSCRKRREMASSSPYPPVRAVSG